MEKKEPVRRGNMELVAEIMIPLDKYPWVRVTDTLRHAVSTIEEAHLKVGLRQSLPRVLLVLDHDDQLVGLVRRRDIMRGLEPGYLVDQPLASQVKYFDVGVDPHLSELAEQVSLERVAKELQKQGNRPVGDVLHPISTTLKPGDPVMKAVYEMVSMNESLIPVVDGDEILGVIRSVDVFHELAKLLGWEG